MHPSKPQKRTSKELRTDCSGQPCSNLNDAENVEQLFLSKNVNCHISNLSEYDWGIIERMDEITTDTSNIPRNFHVFFPNNGRIPCHRNRILLLLKCWPVDAVLMRLISASTMVEKYRVPEILRGMWKCSLRLLKGFSFWIEIPPFETNDVYKGYQIGKIAWPSLWKFSHCHCSEVKKRIRQMRKKEISE